MKLKLALFLVLALGMSFAQQDSGQQQPASGQPAAQQSDVGRPTDTEEPLYKGCLKGTKDNYTLTDDKGQTFRLHSDKDINEHVDNMVEIRGTMKTEGMDRQATSTAGAQQTASTQQQELDVADIKTVSKGCSASESENK